MRRATAWMAVIGLFCVSEVRAQGPDDKGAVLRGFDEPARPMAPAPSAPAGPATRPSIPAARPPATAKTPEYLKQLFPDASAADVLIESGPRRTFSFPEDPPDINQDLQVTPAAGNWMIFIISYQGANGPQQARKMALELRSRRAPAFVFSYGAEDRKKEFDRVRKLLEDQQRFFAERKLTPEQGVRVRYQNIEVQHAVLIGGYSDQEAAKSVLEQVRRWPELDPTKVDLETMFVKQTGPKGITEAKYVNPFKRAFVARNPTVKQDAPRKEQLDIKALRAMNSEETYSLLKCPKRFTLAVKEFQTPFMMQDSKTSSNLWETLGMANKADRVDGAALSAHNLAEALRKAMRVDAYVLHTKYSSVVTVGSYDNPDEPGLKSMQDFLAARFSQ